ncbi:MAG TPA: GatB/YqeY domain-containing protein [Candidatus Limnocylindrales bacterium]|nr:GatB/YqeY domain-containing protein [Candidatus Limnocylindrales bacterium]
MGLKDRLQKDMQKAAKERTPLALSALRMALAEIKNREIEARGELADDAILKTLASMVRRQSESVELFLKGHRPELAEKERAEIAVLSAYLPEGLSGAEVEALAREAIASAGAKTPSDMGRVMKELMPRVAGRADGKLVSEVVRRLLSG